MASRSIHWIYGGRWFFAALLQENKLSGHIQAKKSPKVLSSYPLIMTHGWMHMPYIAKEVKKTASKNASFQNRLHHIVHLRICDQCNIYILLYLD